MLDYSVPATSSSLQACGLVVPGLLLTVSKGDNLFPKLDKVATPPINLFFFKKIISCYAQRKYQL